jgi:uncharacterized protein (TIRG00374 family)
MIVQAAVSAALLVWLLRGLDTHALGRLFATLPSWFYAASLAVVVGGQVLYAWRWWLLLSISGVDLPLSTAIRSYFIGIFANNFLPSTVGGDATKVYYLGRAHGYRTIVASVVVDRMLGLGSAAVLAAAAAWLVPPVSARFVVLRLITTVVAVASCAIIGLTMSGTGGLSRWFKIFGPLAVQAAGQLQRLRLEMAQLLRHPRILAYATALVLAYFVALALVYGWFMNISGTTHWTLLAIFTAVSMTGVLSNIPISLNGLGLREQLNVWLFVPLGVPKEVAVAISLLLFGHVLLTSVGGMVLWLTQPPLALAATIEPPA